MVLSPRPDTLLFVNNQRHRRNHASSIRQRKSRLNRNINDESLLSRTPCLLPSCWEDCYRSHPCLMHNTIRPTVYNNSFPQNEQKCSDVAVSWWICTIFALGVFLWRAPLNPLFSALFIKDWSVTLTNSFYCPRPAASCSRNGKKDSLLHSKWSAQASDPFSLWDIPHPDRDLQDWLTTVQHYPYNSFSRFKYFPPKCLP